MRPIDKPLIISIGMMVPMLMFFSVARFGLRAIGGATLLSAVWVAMIAHYSRRYPHRDEKDIPECREIDGMVRMALENLAQLPCMEELELDDEDKKTLLELFENEPLPAIYRRAVLRTITPDPLPDV